VPFVPVTPPAPLRFLGPVAAITIDAPRRRIFAAGVKSVAVIDADTGKLLATIRIGGTRSLAVEALGGHVFAGTSDGHVAEIDPDRKTVVRTVAAPGPVDALIYNAVLGRLYADGAGRQSVTVYDTRTFTAVEPFAFPGRTPGSMTSDPVTGDLYVADSTPAVSILAPLNGTVRAHFATPGLPGNSIVRIDDVLGQIAIVGGSGMLDIYDRAGTLRWRASVPAGMSSCDIDTGTHVLACTGPAGLSFLQLVREAAPRVAGTLALSAPAFAAFDAKTHDVLAVRSNPDGSGTDFERFTQSDGRDTHPIP
jgi:DNA-binding beta-propeller fold protein YncE